MRGAFALALLGAIACGRDAPPLGGEPTADVQTHDSAALVGGDATTSAPRDLVHGDGRSEPVVVTELPGLCREACDNALAITLAELPENTSAEMKRDLERAVARDCAGRCLQRASLDSARCIARARTALELASCP